MLTPETKSQIREEELYREEVRNELAQQRPKTKGGKLWQFINSSLGIWFLSTVIVGLGTITYTNWQQASARDRALTRAIGMTKTEIGYRLAYFSQLIQSRVGTTLSYEAALDMLDGAPDTAPEGYSPGNFPQFRGYPLNLLYDQLSELVGTDDRSKLDGLGKFHMARMRLRQLPPPPEGQTEAWKARVAGTIKEAFEGLHASTPLLPDWKSAYPVYAQEFFEPPTSQ